ncbi:lipopolysaccharide biosynthesis protein [Flavobacterium daemonense]|uniref:lipopolysaccharide biosynthesis protein n=1 Tax=Flavobacterium daemonense TaxID=1393049 RepID=UPI001184871E|nr:oligosaccharide flippase family protein [Flavobacterium daemonense]KAF2332506.1 oligosaccharide flippase family protein [Flavobacterium daemonense]
MFKKIQLKFNSFFSEGHSRTLLAKKNIAASFLIKAGSIFVGLLLIPMTINYINPTQYGIWLTLSSLISWFSFFDIGLGNGLKNKLAEAKALNQIKKSQIYISTTYALLTLISAFIFLLFFCINPFLDWKFILNISHDDQSLEKVVLIIVGFFCVSFVIQLINTILIANHKSAKSSLISLIGSFLSLLIIFVLSKYTKATLIKLVMVLLGIPLLVQVVFTIWLFKTSLSDLAPTYNQIDLKYTKELLSIGGVFFIIQIGAVVLFQTDNIVITQLFGPKEVTVFNIAYKLFSVIIMIFTIIITPFWSSFTDAYAQNDLKWINEIILKMQKYWLLLVVLTVFLLIISPVVFRLWLGEKVEIPLRLSIAMTFYVLAYTWQTIHVFLLNGIGKIRLQLYLVVISAVMNIPIAVYLGKKIGLAGITFSNAILFLIMGVVFSIQCKKILNNTATGIWGK